LRKTWDWKRGLARAALMGACAAWLAASAAPTPAAAQQGRDPFQGRFGAMELPMAPRDAARQAELLGAALSGLSPQRPGTPDVYVLTASLWSDPVFEREASQAAAILAEHLGAQGRTLVLSAGTGQASRQYANSSPNNLMAALGKIGLLIDPREDLVVVFLTSHGSPDGSAALRDQDRLTGSLRPVHLRDALSSAGIRNRVVIVSSCFSGLHRPARRSQYDRADGGGAGPNLVRLSAGKRLDLFRRRLFQPCAAGGRRHD